jgi:pullulanase
MFASNPRTKVLSRVKALGVVGALLLLTLPSQAFAAAPATIHLTVHYQRPAEDYTNWNLWLWKNVIVGNDQGEDAQDKAFSPAEGSAFTESDAFGKVFKADITDMNSFDNVGIIVRKGAWVSKDISVNRFITNFDASGNAEVWIVQDDATIYTAAPALGKSMKSAKLDDFRAISVDLSQKILLSGSGDEGFTITGGLKVASVTALVGSAAGATRVQLNVDSDATIGSDYTVTQTSFGSVKVTAGKIIESDGFNARYLYTGNDLGNAYSAASTTFRVWAPTASAVSLLTYPKASTPSTEAKVIPMASSAKGTWVVTLTGDQDGTIYDYRVTLGNTINDAVDPYVRATTANGEHGVVVNLSKTYPANWKNSKPAFSGKATDAVIYELHVRDLSQDSSSNIPTAHKGKYLALTDVKTSMGDSTKTGVSAIKDLGVTHVELQPIFDYASVDELNPSFNWGYDPQNYNVPEGSYSSNPSNPTARITELKSGIQALHDQGLRVMMDVVYNHVFAPAGFSQEKIVPGYFFRKNADGSLTNGSGCGNDVASERPMVRKFIVDSAKYWATQYNMDGFRFDLMGLIDLTTMQQVRSELTKINPTILIIGEGWDMGTLPDAIRSNQKNIDKLPGIAAFNDELRDGVKGSVFNSTDNGFATGKATAAQSVQAGIVGNVFYSREVLGKWFTNDPTQSVNYVEAHDNLTLFDKLTASVSGATPAKIEALDRLSASIALLAQGVPFMQAGQEFLRSKNGDSNSYKSSDAINSIKWDLRAKNASTVNYYKGIIALRKAHPAFRLATTPLVQKNLTFIKAPTGVIAYSLKGAAVKDSWGSIVVVHNPGASSATVTLPSKGDWKVVVQGAKAGVKVIQTLKSATKVSVPAMSTLVVEK